MEEEKPLEVVEIEEEDEELKEEDLVDSNGEFIIFGGEEGKQEEGGLEANFSKLSRTNKVNVLLKALMMERNKSYESRVKIDILKTEYQNKCRMVAE
jgi:hypothetical protein